MERDLTSPPRRANRAPRVGVDEWVAQADTLKERPTGVAGVAQRIGRVVTPAIRLALFVASPRWSAGSVRHLFNYGIFVLLYVLLGLGLNVVVGFAGLLDLGYVAFFGFGAYLYALLSSEHYGIHWPAIVTMPLVVAATACSALSSGSRRAASSGTTWRS